MFGGFSVGIMFLLRYNITISILRMVNQTHLYLEEHPESTVEDMLSEGYTPGGEFNWNNKVQQMIMSLYMVAYTLPQIPATKFASMIGLRKAIPISLSLCAISTLATPYSAYLGWEYVVALRLVNGIGASCILPMLLTLIESWMRHDEISLGLSLAHGLTSILAALNPLVAGYLSSIHWSYSFYIPGCVTLLFCALWFLMITDDPAENFLISEKELDHICDCNRIRASLAQVQSDGRKDSSNQQVQQPQDDGLDYKPRSWTQILLIPSFYAYMFMWCCYCCAYSGFSFILPTYLRQFLKIKIAQNGLYCFLIQSGCVLAVSWPHFMLGFLEHRCKLSKVVANRVSHFICCSVVAATWIYVGCFHESQIILLFINRCFHNGNDIIVTGSLMSNFAKAGITSLVFSMVNTIGNLSTVLASSFFGWLLDYTAQSRFGWCLIFTSLGVSQLVMWLVFATLVRPEPIKFNNNRLNNKDPEVKLQRSISAQIEQGGDKGNEKKSCIRPALSNLTNLSDSHGLNSVKRESRQI